GAAFQIVLRVNPTGLGSAAQKLFAGSREPNAILFAAFSWIAMGALLACLAHMRRLSIVTGLLCGVILVSFTAVASSLIDSPLLSAKYAVIALRGAQAFLWCVVWVLVSSGLWKVGAVFFAAAGVGNFVSFLYPPYGVVDFMWSSLLNRAI